MAERYSDGREVDPKFLTNFLSYLFIFSKRRFAQYFLHVLTAQTDSFSEYQHD